MADNRTLKEALEQTYRERWAGTRSEKTTMSQAEIAAAHIIAHFHGDAWRRGLDLRQVTLAEVEPHHIRAATAEWYKAGLSPATINKRLNCLSAMGISVEGCRVKNPKKLQWWLRPEVEKDVVAWLRRPGMLGQMADFVAWTTRTGLRVEETLALRRHHFSADFREVTVPGTKTGAAQATLALGDEAQALARSRFPMNGTPISAPQWPFMGMTYETLHERWQEVRKEFGFTDPTATLKALRRSAARYLHYDRGMPLDMVRQYLRHENIETTMGYLRLTGGVSLDEQRRYLG